ncbi:hypothetical protein BHE74_00045961 [Ensete ventricosum]|nr:hypothetical protein BHE74_00045961 [Ensete ventricosum]
MITLCAEGSLTTTKETMRILVLGSSSEVMGRVVMPTGVIASLGVAPGKIRPASAFDLRTSLPLGLRRVSEVSYKAICALNAMMCSARSEPPSYASSIGRESVESESKESVSRSDRLRIDALGVGVGRLAVSPEGTRSNTIGN